MKNYRDERLDIIETAFLMDMHVSMTAFRQMCPEYIDTPQNAAAIASFFNKEIHRAPTALEIYMAYQEAVKAGKIGRPN